MGHGHGRGMHGGEKAKDFKGSMAKLFRYMGRYKFRFILMFVFLLSFLIRNIYVMFFVIILLFLVIIFWSLLFFWLSDVIVDLGTKDSGKGYHRAVFRAGSQGKRNRRNQF